MFSSDGNFLIYGNDAKIWLIFDKNGNEIGLYREVPDAPPNRLASTNAVMNAELEAAQAEFQKLFQAI